MAAPASRPITPDVYLEAERKATTRHELVNGDVYAMAGASRWHVLLVTRFASQLDRRLEGTGYSTGSSELRVRVPFSEAYLYPDVVVYCGEGRWRDSHFDTLEDPLLVVEVLSPTTESYDRGAKFEHYRLIQSLQTFVLVAQDTVLVEVFTRQSDDRWLYEAFNELSQEVWLPALDVRIPLASLYERIPVTAGPRAVPTELSGGRLQTD